MALFTHAGIEKGRDVDHLNRHYDTMYTCMTLCFKLSVQYLKTLSLVVALFD